MNPPHPTLLLVHGLPASGKTTLAKYLAQALRWPVIHKDDIKEILFDTISWGDRAWSRQLGLATIEVLWHVVESQLVAGVSCLAESNFKPMPASQRLREITSKTHARCVQVLCSCKSEVRLARFQSRQRHPGHADGEVSGNEADAWRAETLGPIDIYGPLVKVDTTDLSGVDYDAILRQVRAAITSSPDATPL